MLPGMHVEKLKGRTTIEVPKPTRLQIPHGQIGYISKTEQQDFAFGKPSPVRQPFHDRFQIKKVKGISGVEVSVFHVLARSTRWAVAAVLIDNRNQPILNSDGKGQVVIIKPGNITSTKTIRQIASEAGCSYGAAAKALNKWEKLGVIRRLTRVYKTQVAKKEEQESGRPVDLRRYEIDPHYAWNGYNWLGVAYEAHLLSQNLKILSPE